ncbi:sugar phosphate isomerase/epimerase [Panacibacter ginsenosidivorans]|uniref:Sugar phosphate isomerase/epimerase n=1 Tax=Panacibacter ginsenosidivorans TaxID=1813871 RepID=A0A5B8V5Z7_9BACT|nr:sugar phosphate isomerase/epimerase [Panacibacter ginsenosidivorans]QEC66840.1 sugar phosphate isomerase/epimerase [Panacibacter ginsenosidivorans]
MKNGNIKLSTSLFSFALEWNSGKYSLEQMIAKVKELDLGPGLEIIGFQSLKGFPNIPDSTIAQVKSLIEKFEFEPACLDANVDVAIRRDRHLTVDETVEYLKPQLMVAAKLGFPVLRVQMTAKPEVMRKLEPLAEKVNVKLGMELHTPYLVDHPSVIALRELYEELDSPYLGFIPDFGTSMRNIPDALLNSFREVGVTNEQIAVTKEIWKKDIPTPAKFGELYERASTLGATAPQIGRLNMAFSMNGRQPVDAWKEIIPQTVHLHGKFYGFDENGDEPSIDYAAILKVFYEGGYNGYISSEYEGTAFTDEFTGFEMVQKHHALCKKILKGLEEKNYVSA